MVSKRPSLSSVMPDHREDYKGDDKIFMNRWWPSPLRSFTRSLSHSLIHPSINLWMCCVSCGSAMSLQSWASAGEGPSRVGVRTCRSKPPAGATRSGSSMRTSGFPSCRTEWSVEVNQNEDDRKSVWHVLKCEGRSASQIGRSASARSVVFETLRLHRWQCSKKRTSQ